MRRKFHVGDKVKVIGMSPVTFPPGVKDEMGTEKLFKSMLTHVGFKFPITTQELANATRSLVIGVLQRLAANGRRVS